jgi:hypothetical protein
MLRRLRLQHEKIPRLVPLESKEGQLICQRLYCDEINVSL